MIMTMEVEVVVISCAYPGPRYRYVKATAYSHIGREGDYIGGAITGMARNISTCRTE